MKREVQDQITVSGKVVCVVLMLWAKVSQNFRDPYFPILLMTDTSTDSGCVLEFMPQTQIPSVSSNMRCPRCFSCKK